MRLAKGMAQSFYRPELDALRWYGAFGVFVYHTMPRGSGFYADHHFPRWIARAVSSLVTGGAYGVDLFFVLSAYLITELLRRERQRTGMIRVQHFYLRRICRIWPLYFLVLAISLAVTRFDPQQNLTWRQALAFALFSGNWLFVLNPDAIYSVANPLWSISVEEQFYLAWPWVVKLGSIRRIACMMLAVSWLVRLTFVLSGVHLGIWDNTLARLDPIAAGALLAVGLDGRLPRLRSATRMLFVAAGVALIGVAAALPASEFPANPWVLALYPMIAVGACLIVCGSLGSNVPLLTNRAVVYLGGISYGIYVFHRPCLWFVKHIYFHTYNSTVVGQFAYWAAALTLTIGVSALSKRYFESPFLRLKQRYAHAGSGASAPPTQPIIAANCFQQMCDAKSRELTG
jgi:peptidoglycan/LPS O-acetylase OafA/YrhL